MNNNTFNYQQAQGNDAEIMHFMRTQVLQRCAIDRTDE